MFIDFDYLYLTIKWMMKFLKHTSYIMCTLATLYGAQMMHLLFLLFSSVPEKDETVFFKKRKTLLEVT